MSCRFVDERIREDFMRHKPLIYGAPMVVEFGSRFEEVPPPDPCLLALHATCARVTHMSGATEYFQLPRDWNFEPLDDDDLD